MFHSGSLGKVGEPPKYLEIRWQQPMKSKGKLGIVLREMEYGPIRFCEYVLDNHDRRNEQEDGLKNQDSLCDIFLCELVAAYLHFFVLSLKQS
jgi:hypothetical protein